ncbi:MAG: formate dehydrogenase accessory sulfurtransferase FdhD [Bacteroidetes bacterium]|nr:formate dehydrogenase accessory sulfurtransferase FdhD [Bacteroidota bacterium]
MSTALYKGRKFCKGKFLPVEDALAVEELLKITINGSPYTITMRTPGSEEELVRGLLFSENVYTDLQFNPVISIKEKNNSGFIKWIDVVIPLDKIGKGFESVRNIMSVSSCGICGKTDLDEIAGQEQKIIQTEKLKPETVDKMFEQMNSNQNTFKASGGSHGCAVFTLEGELLAIQEDIGRHNAVDKAIGCLILEKKLRKARCMTVSGRISYEIVTKCFSADIPFLSAVSAPSSLAVDLAEQLGITLMAFCRDNKFTAYSRIDNIEFQSDHEKEFNQHRLISDGKS